MPGAFLLIADYLGELHGVDHLVCVTGSKGRGCNMDRAFLCCFCRAAFQAEAIRLGDEVERLRDALKRKDGELAACQQRAADSNAQAEGLAADLSKALVSYLTAPDLPPTLLHPQS